MGITDGGLQVRVDSRRWEAVLPNVFRLAGVPSFWRQQLQAALLWAGPHAAVSHRAAALLWELGGSFPAVVELTLPYKTRVPPGNLIVHYSNRLADEDRTAIGGLATTTVARTLADLGAVTRRWKVQDALDHALRLNMTSRWELHATLARVGGKGRRGVGMLRGLLDDPLQGTVAPGSPLERRLLSVLAATGIPEPVRQYPIYDEDGLIGRVDFAWPDVKVGLEADGYNPHTSRRSFRHDRERRNRATRVGWRLLHATWDDHKRFSTLASTLRSFFP
jgi:hypothetical protein